MAHNITEHDMVGSLEGSEWHGLAREGPQGVADARAFLLSWRVKKVPAYAMTGDGTFTKVSDLFTLVRSDTNLPIPSCSYGPRTEPVQNSDRDALIEAMLKLDPRMQLSACGCYESGARVSYTLSCPDQSILVGKSDDRNTPFVNLLGDNTGTRSELFGAGMTRAICDNTYHMALSEAQAPKDETAQTGRRWRRDWLAIRHTKSASLRLREATRILDVTKLALSQTQSDLQRLLSVPFSPKGGDLSRYYDAVMPYPLQPTPTGDSTLDKRADSLYVSRKEKITAIRKCWFDTFQEEQAALASDPNLWLAYNSVTKWVQHSWLPRTNSTTFVSSGARELSNLLGRGHELTVAARDAALSFTPSNP